MDLSLQPVAQSIFLDLQFEASLKIHPEPLGGTEEARQPERRIGGNPPDPFDDFIDPPGGDMNLLRQSILGNSHGLEKFLQENLARMDRLLGLLFSHGAPRSEDRRVGKEYPSRWRGCRVD